MSSSRDVSSVSGSTDISSVEEQLSNLAIHVAIDTVLKAAELVEAMSKEQPQNVIGQHVSKRFAELMYDGVIESHDNVSETFKVVYTNGHSEEMRLEDLMKYLVPREQPLPPDTNELANEDHEIGEGLVHVAPAPPSQKHGRTRKMSSGSKRKEVANKVCPPRQAGKRAPQRSAGDNEALEMVLLPSAKKNRTSEVMNLRRSTRKRKELGYSYREDTTDDNMDVDVDVDEPDYPLPPIIQVPWADMEEEDPPDVPMKGICTAKGYKGRDKRQWVSLRICAASYHRDGTKKAADGSER